MNNTDIKITNSINNTIITVSPKKTAAPIADKLQAAGINVVEIRYKYAGDMASVIVYTAVSNSKIMEVINN